MSDTIKRAPTFDGFDNFISRVGLRNNNALSGGGYTLDYKTNNRQQLEAAYRGSWIVGAIVDSIPEDMTRAGIEISTNEDEADIKDLQSSISRLQIWQSLCDTKKWARLYGGAIAVIQIEGQNLATPLNIDSVGPKQFQGLSVYDRWQLNPSMAGLIKSGPEMGLPEYYSIVDNPTSLSGSTPESVTGQLTVHHSRCIRQIGIKLPYFQAITTMLWGESVLERLWDRLIAFDEATMSSASLIDRASLRTVKIEGLRELVAAGGDAVNGLIGQFEMMRLAQVNEGLTLLDKNDEFASTAYSFAGLSDMMLQFAQQLSGASSIPLIRLLGQSPAGLAATGESDIRMYYDYINAKQEAEFRPGIEKLLKVMWRSVYGRPAPKDLEFTFTPLWQMSAIDKANVTKTLTETVIGAYETTLVTKEAAMKELRDMSGDTGIFNNITDEDIIEAENEEPPMPGEADMPPGFSEAKAPSEAKEGEESTPDKPKSKDHKFVDADFKESDHPRKKDGKFGRGGSSSQTSKPKETYKSKEKPKQSEKPSAEQASAIRNYTGALSSQFIEADRGGKVDEMVEKKNKDLNSYLEKAPKFEGDIHRGIVVEKSDVDSLLAKYKEGESVETDSKQSWTKDPKSVGTRLTQVAKEKKDPVKVFFEYPDSKASIDVSEESRFPEEQEVIIPKSSSYVVSKVEKTGDGYKIIFKAKSIDSKWFKPWRS